MWGNVFGGEHCGGGEEMMVGGRGVRGQGCASREKGRKEVDVYVGVGEKKILFGIGEEITHALKNIN